MKSKESSSTKKKSMKSYKNEKTKNILIKSIQLLMTQRFVWKRNRKKKKKIDQSNIINHTIAGTHTHTIQAKKGSKMYKSKVI